MRKLGVIALALMLGLIVCWWWSGPPTTPTPPTPVVPNDSSIKSPPIAAPSVPSANPSSSAQGSPLAGQLNAPDGNAEQDVATLLELVRQYLRAMRRITGPPIGDDIDLARVLTGRNPLKLAVIPRDHPALSADGHLRDRWGTPYFIHPRSSDSFEIRSAGPDKKLFTADDAVANPPR